ncbi:Protein N-acetyltransferase, RimJ/RimL family [Pseudobutyrivibrio sp. UC1225]|uniref:GNAT family N-acetyltransferase n=1 Tax=Pseudobutyrivibrio sp. UC1225 TaxID=1798185 RepID=UPI0008F35CD6|nr:GNAT family N-acetyltransferase [Pseudobutyrivibrio sp. UC1225]SFN78271.1 Protein N-acetyltransferase, RimJ/RimL family [Pseudobutyrivibrio sp. UC1225]
MKIEGERVFLTPITYDDCEDYIRWRNSDLIKSRFIYRKDLTVEDQRNWIKNMVETGKVAQFIIWDKNDNKKIGSVYLQKIDQDKKDGEFGILIGEVDYLNGGRGSEAARLINRYGFEELGLKKIYLRVLASNDRAIHTYEKVGFRPEKDGAKKYIEIDGVDTEVLFMSVENAE